MVFLYFKDGYDNRVNYLANYSLPLSLYTHTHIFSLRVGEVLEFRKRDLIRNTLPSRLLLNVLSDGISPRLQLFKEAHFTKDFFLPQKGKRFCSEAPFNGGLS